MEVKRVEICHVICHKTTSPFSRPARRRRKRWKNTPMCLTDFTPVFGTWQALSEYDEQSNLLINILLPSHQSGEFITRFWSPFVDSLSALSRFFSGEFIILFRCPPIADDISILYCNPPRYFHSVFSSSRPENSMNRLSPLP
jgi:hypothetical protein